MLLPNNLKIIFLKFFFPRFKNSLTSMITAAIIASAIMMIENT